MVLSRLDILSSKLASRHHRLLMYGTASRSRLLLHLLVFAAHSLGATAQLRSESPERHGGRRFTPSMAIIIVILICAFFLMAFFSVYLRLCTGDMRNSASSLRRNANRARARRSSQRGLERSVVDAFPTFEYSAVKGLKLGSEALECAVCLNEFEDEETLRLLPKCNHVFHPDCIGAWLTSHTTCPVCRASLVPQPPDAAAAAAPPSAAAGAEADSRDEAPLYHVAVDICQDPPPESENPSELPVLVHNRSLRSKSTKPPFRFPRSHTTGHLLVPPGENLDRFTLRLPEQVRKDIFDGVLNRSASCTAFRTEGRSASVGGSRSAGLAAATEGGVDGDGGRFQWRFSRAAKSDRWAFLAAAPAFFSRTFSARSQKRAEGDQTPSQKGVVTAVKTPFDCLGGKTDVADGETPSRDLTPVFTVSTQSQH